MLYILCPGYYFSGDGARRTKDGYYQITGRMDDVLNVSGHRLGTAEIEDVLVYDLCSNHIVKLDYKITTSLNKEIEFSLCYHKSMCVELVYRMHCKIVFNFTLLHYLALLLDNRLLAYKHLDSHRPMGGG